MKKLLAIAAFATLGFAGSAQAGGYGHGYGYGYAPAYGYTVVARPVVRVVRPVVVRRVIVKHHYVPTYYGY